jgi:hypothetical protein
MLKGCPCSWYLFPPQLLFPLHRRHWVDMGDTEMNYCHLLLKVHFPYVKTDVTHGLVEGGHPTGNQKYLGWLLGG